MKKATAGVLAALALTLAAADLAQAQCYGSRCRDRDRGRDRDRHEHSERRRSYNPLPLSVEVRLDAGIPTGDADDVLDNGLGWEVTGAFDVAPLLAIYAGYSSFQFDVDDDIDPDDEVETDGFGVGGRVRLGGHSMWSPFAQFGALFHDDETGFEVGLGGDYGVGNQLSVTPMVRYRSVDELDYVTLGVGLNLHF
jgi:hypothetical protein